MYLLIFVSYDNACSFSKTRLVLSIPFLFLLDFLRILGKYISSHKPIQGSPILLAPFYYNSLCPVVMYVIECTINFDKEQVRRNEIRRVQVLTG